MNLEPERLLAERRHRVAEAVRVMQSELREIDAQLAAARVKRVASLDSRIADREAEERARAEHDRNPPPLAFKERD